MLFPSYLGAHSWAGDGAGQSSSAAMAGLVVVGRAAKQPGGPGWPSDGSGSATQGGAPVGPAAGEWEAPQAQQECAGRWDSPKSLTGRLSSLFCQA